MHGAEREGLAGICRKMCGIHLGFTEPEEQDELGLD